MNRPSTRVAPGGEQAATLRLAQRLRARRDQLDYAGTLAAGLPIGSGLIESGHRHVVPARLKKSGAWWKEGNARANGDWESYWHVSLHPLNN